MTTNWPFTPTSGATAGNSVKVTGNATPTSVSGSLDCTGTEAARIRIKNTGTVLAFVRVSAEATPVATNADIPLGSGDVLIVQNPVPQGKTGLAVLSSTTTAVDVFFTPGEGGA